jgi:hypothetical protein
MGVAVSSGEYNMASYNDTVVSGGSFSTARGVADVNLGGHHSTMPSPGPRATGKTCCYALSDIIIAREA